MAAAQEVRRFTARIETDSRQHTHTVNGSSFEDAAFEFVDRWHPQADDAGEVAVVVTDFETGEQHCFRVDLESGEAAPCP
jgi:hypothetical protein